MRTTEPEITATEPTTTEAGPEVVGARMRQFRTEKGLTLRGLAARSGLSIGFLSQVERGISAIGLTALGSVASALGRNVADFFHNETPPEASNSHHADAELPPHFTLTRHQAPGTQYVSGQQTYQLLSERGKNLVLEPMLVHIAPGARKGDAYGHAGEEFAYVVEGELVYEVEGVAYRLYPGDSLHLRSSTPHQLYNDTGRVTTVVSVVTPRLF